MQARERAEKFEAKASEMEQQLESLERKLFSFPLDIILNSRQKRKETNAMLEKHGYRKSPNN